MTKEQAIERLKKMIQINNGVIKEARKNGDIFAMQLTADLDTDSIAIEKVLTMLKEKDKTISSKDKIIDLMANHIATSDSDLCEYLDITTKCKYYAGENGKTCDNCIKQYFENKVKERR
jgi:hypothetical protein